MEDFTEPDPTALYRDRPVKRPTAGAWARHFGLLMLTLCTATLAGSMFPFGRYDSFPANDPQNAEELLHFFLTIPERYAGVIGGAVANLYNNPADLQYGLSFSLSLLFILLCHEFGHYIACRLYRVDATLPFFLPTPPMIGPAGTFGAFIKILSPMPSRKAVFDIGVAGPIAGFIALIPVALVGLATMQTIDPADAARYQGALVFTDPLMMRLLAGFFGINLTYGIGNAFYFAAWVGLLVTALNLIPSGQLDGGHAIFAVFGEKVHRWTGRIAFAVMATLSVVGFVFFNSPSGFLIALILFIMMRVRHPSPWDTSPLDLKRKIIAALTLLVFILCFVPFPIQVN